MRLQGGAMEKFLLTMLVTAAVSWVTTVSAQECYTDSTCSAEDDKRYCDMFINRCTDCKLPCGEKNGDTAACHNGCSLLCRRLKNSATADDHDRYPKCWKNLPPTTPAISTRRTTTKGPQGCLGNQDVCRHKQFCNEASNSCISCAIPCGQRGSFRSCQNHCPTWCERLSSRPQVKKDRKRYPLCWPTTTTTPPTSPTSPSSPPPTTEPAVPTNPRVNEPVGGSYLDGKITNIPPFLKTDDNKKPPTTREPTNHHQHDSEQIKIYALAAVCGLVSVVCVVQFVIIVKQRRTRRVKKDGVEEATGGIPLQDVTHTSGTATDREAEAMLTP